MNEYDWNNAYERDMFEVEAEYREFRERLAEETDFESDRESLNDEPVVFEQKPLWITLTLAEIPF
jgi:hypothetical protein